MSHLVADTTTILRRELLRYRRDRVYWVGQAIFPLLAVAFVGFGLAGVVSLPSGTSYPAHLATGVLALLVGSGGVGAGFTLLEDRESGFLRALLIAPVSAASLVLGKLVARALASLVLVAVMVGVFATFTAFGPIRPAVVALAVIGITAVFVGLGVVIAAQLKSLESFRMLAAGVTLPLYFLSGIFYPIDTLPAVTRAIARANPLTYGVDLLRYGLLGVSEIPPATSATLLVALTAIALVGAIWAFERRARALA